MSELPAPPPSWAETAIDGIATAFFAVFVAVLFLGFENSSFPYAPVAILPLLGSLVALFWGNLSSDRRARAQPLHGSS